MSTRACDLTDSVPLVDDHAVMAAAVALGVDRDAAEVLHLRADLDVWAARFPDVPRGHVVDEWYRAVIARG